MAAVTKVCIICGDTFEITDNRGNRKLCSSECRRKRTYQRSREYRTRVATYVARPPRPCEACGSMIPMRRKQRFCSPCSKEYQKSLTPLFFESRRTRAAMYSLAEANPRLAEKIRSEMISMEGPEFTELAINGVIEKVKSQGRLR